MEASLQSSNSQSHTTAERESICVREIFEPCDVVAALRLRHKIYFEEQHYGPTRALRLDLTSHDTRSRLFGVFRAERLVGSLRLVLRVQQPLAEMFRALHDVADSVPEQTATSLPSEEAFDLRASIGADQERVDGELGRFALDGGALPPRLVQRVMLVGLAAAKAAGCRLYMYSCATSIAKAYARVTAPRYVLAPRADAGIASDRFIFPKPTLAVVAAVEDSPYAHTVEQYASLLQQRQTIALCEGIRSSERRALRGLLRTPASVPCGG